MALEREIISLLMLIYRQLVEIIPFWAGGILAGALLTVYGSGAIQALALRLGSCRRPLAVTILAAVLGAASPVCMYGTVPLIASLGRRDVPHYLLAAFMVSSILINPNLFVFSFALGTPVALIRLFNSILAGVAAGFMVRRLMKGGQIFRLQGFVGKDTCTADMTRGKRMIRSLVKTIRITAPYVMLGILISALYQQYFPQEIIMRLFGSGNGFGVLLAATIGVPTYMCGGGTIPLMQSWMYSGMSIGSVTAFMVTGPATKLNNLSAVKTILGTRNFVLYLAFAICYSVLSGFAVDFAVRIL